MGGEVIRVYGSNFGTNYTTLHDAHQLLTSSVQNSGTPGSYSYTPSSGALAVTMHDQVLWQSCIGPFLMVSTYPLLTTS